MQEKNIHWFPGHMQKALKEVALKIKLVDIIIELLDARAPLSSRNDALFQMTKSKKRLVILTKTDLADDAITTKWINYFVNQGNTVASMDLLTQKPVEIIKNKISMLGQEKKAKELKKGMKPQPIRAMIIGIPNVGKSTLINRISSRNAASVENTPGHTKSQQWIKVDKDFELLDTPGILPANYEDKQKAINLALLGSIKQEILPIDELVNVLLTFLKQNYLSQLQNRYKIEISSEDDNYFIMQKICDKRGLFLKKEYDFQRGNITLLKEFRNGEIGHISLEK